MSSNPFPPLSRRALFGTSAALAAASLLGPSSLTTAMAAPLPTYRTREAYEEAWGALNLAANNEAGGFAWGASYVLLSLVRMYEATGDKLYLDRFVELADRVWAGSDRGRGVADHRGVSEWVWRAAGNYTASRTEVTDAKGTPLFDMRYATVRSIEGRIEITRSGGGTFDMRVIHPVAGTHDLLGLTLDPASPDHVVTRVNEGYYQPGSIYWTAKMHDGVPPTALPAVGSYEAQAQYYVFSVHTGMVTYPIALFSRLVTTSHLPAYRGKAQQYLQKLRRAVAFHDHEWHWTTLSDGSRGGYYAWAKGSPLPHDGTIQLTNQMVGLGQTMAVLATMDPRRYADKVAALARTVLSEMRLDGRAWRWSYWPTFSQAGQGYTDRSLSEYTPWHTPYGDTQDDLSHAAITLEFLTSAHHAGLVVTEDHLRHLSHTWTDNMLRPPTGFHWRVDGTTLATTAQAHQAGRWIPLAPWTPGMADYIDRAYVAIRMNPVSAWHPLVIAYLVWADAQAWRG